MSTSTDARVTIDLGGMWRYRPDPDAVGKPEGWYRPTTDHTSWGEMRIPTNWYLTEVGDYFGVMWFATCFTPPEGMEGRHLTLRFNAVDYAADVWLNGEYLGNHLGYFLPFEFDVLKSSQVDFYCRCSKPGFMKKLLTLGIEEIENMESDGNNILTCHYCNEKYTLDKKDFFKLKEEIKAKQN